MKKNRVVVLGGGGLLGSYLVPSLLDSRFDVISISKNSLSSDYQIDITDVAALNDLLYILCPDFIINLVAITDVDYCETHIQESYLIHVKLCDNLCSYCQNENVRLVHISTDHFYDKALSIEEDVNPKNVYALTKLMGEIKLSACDSVVLRTNFFGKSLVDSRSSITDTMYTRVKSGESVQLFNNVFFSPLSLKSLCFFIKFVMCNWHAGVYNLGSRRGMSKQEFVLTFLKLCGFDNISFSSVDVDDVKFNACRPKDMRMNSSLFEHTFSVKVPTLLDELNLVAKEYNGT